MGPYYDVLSTRKLRLPGNVTQVLYSQINIEHRHVSLCEQLMDLKVAINVRNKPKQFCIGKPIATTFMLAYNINP